MGKHVTCLLGKETHNLTNTGLDSVENSQWSLGVSRDTLTQSMSARFTFSRCCCAGKMRQQDSTAGRCPDLCPRTADSLEHVALGGHRHSSLQQLAASAQGAGRERPNVPGAFRRCSQADTRAIHPECRRLWPSLQQTDALDAEGRELFSVHSTGYSMHTTQARLLDAHRPPRQSRGDC